MPPSLVILSVTTIKDKSWRRLAISIASKMLLVSLMKNASSEPLVILRLRQSLHMIRSKRRLTNSEEIQLRTNWKTCSTRETDTTSSLNNLDQTPQLSKLLLPERGLPLFQLLLMSLQTQSKQPQTLMKSWRVSLKPLKDPPNSQINWLEQELMTTWNLFLITLKKKNSKNLPKILPLVFLMLLMLMQ